eukprot:4188178-Pyramimonas_sp.AAC.1
MNATAPCCAQSTSFPLALPNRCRHNSPPDGSSFRSEAGTNPLWRISKSDMNPLWTESGRKEPKGKTGALDENGGKHGKAYPILPVIETLFMLVLFYPVRGHPSI